MKRIGLNSDGILLPISRIRTRVYRDTAIEQTPILSNIDPESIIIVPIVQMIIAEELVEELPKKAPRKSKKVKT